MREDAVEPVRETAFCLTLWHAFLTGLVGVLLLVLNDIEAATALLIAANIVLLYALVLIARAGRLNKRGILRSQVWRTLTPRRRPSGEAGLIAATEAVQQTWLRFAKGAAAAAIVLSAFAYASKGSEPASAKADLTRSTLSMTCCR
jgi:hypothetical protein